MACGHCGQEDAACSCAMRRFRLLRGKGTRAERREPLPDNVVALASAAALRLGHPSFHRLSAPPAATRHDSETALPIFIGLPPEPEDEEPLSIAALLRGEYPAPSAASRAIPRVETNHLADVALGMGFTSLLLPVLAIPAVFFALVAWGKTLVRRSVPGRWMAVSAIFAAMVMAPIGIAAYGTYWYHQVPDLRAFGSGAEINKVPVVDPGHGLRLVSSQVHGGGWPNGPIYQMRVTSWSNSARSETQTTSLYVATNSDGGYSLYSHLREDLKATRAHPLALTHNGPVVVEVEATGRDAALLTRTELASRARAQLAVVPASVSDLNLTTNRFLQRRSEVRDTVIALFVADVLLLVLCLALAVITLLTDAGRLMSGSPPRAWYQDPTSRFDAREWTGRRWGSRVIVNGRTRRDPLTPTG